jgi:hypothetical protein
MKPDRYNYETWLIDWLDGTLNVQQTDELMAFLGENPDIRDEADSLMLARISPSPDHFTGKEKLIKSVSDITSLQVEYLSAAYFEGDLSPEQETDLRKHIEMNPDNRIIFEKIRRTKLHPPLVHYRNKSRLRKIYISAGIVRISLIGLSAAAVTVFLLLNHMFIPRHGEETSIAVATMTTDTIYSEAPIIKQNGNNMRVLQEAQKDAIKTGKKIASPVISDYLPSRNLSDSLMQIERIQGPESVAYTTVKEIDMPAVKVNTNLIASAISFSEPIYDDERSSLSRFISRTFRAKILKEKKAGDEPLKTYEIAEAGIDGLNKLLGWQMALVKTNDEAGDLKSVYFSSRVLKFNAPVRKTTAVQ